MGPTLGSCLYTLIKFLVTQWCRPGLKIWGKYSATQISRIFGHGTLSGDLIPQPKSVEPPIEESEYCKYKSININNADIVTVDGITVTNAAFHTFNLVMIQY